MVPLFLGLALLGCWVGRDAVSQLRHWDAWDSVPEEVKEWLEAMAPTPTQKQTMVFEDLGSFPTDVGYPGPTPTGKE